MARLVLSQPATTVFGWNGTIVAIDPNRPLSIALSHPQKRGKPIISWYRKEEVIAQ